MSKTSAKMLLAYANQDDIIISSNIDNKPPANTYYRQACLIGKMILDLYKLIDGVTIDPNDRYILFYQKKYTLACTKHGDRIEVYNELHEVFYNNAYPFYEYIQLSGTGNYVCNTYYNVLPTVVYKCVFVDPEDVDILQSINDEDIHIFDIYNYIQICDKYLVNIDNITAKAIDKYISNAFDTWSRVLGLNKEEDYYKDTIKVYDSVDVDGDCDVDVDGDVDADADADADADIDDNDAPTDTGNFISIDNERHRLMEYRVSGIIHHEDYPNFLEQLKNQSKHHTALNIPDEMNRIILAIKDNLFMTYELEDVNYLEYLRNLFDLIFYNYTKVAVTYNDHDNNNNNCGNNGNRGNKGVNKPIDYHLTLLSLRQYICINPLFAPLLLHPSVRKYDIIWTSECIDTIFPCRKLKKLDAEVDTRQPSYTMSAIGQKFVKMNWCNLYALDFANYNNATHDSPYIIKFNTENDNILVGSVFATTGQIGYRYTVANGLNIPSFRPYNYAIGLKDLECLDEISEIINGNSTNLSVSDTSSNSTNLSSANTSSRMMSKIRDILEIFNHFPPNESCELCCRFLAVDLLQKEQIMTRTYTNFASIVSSISDGILDESFCWDKMWLVGSTIYSIVSGYYSKAPPNDFDLICVVPPEYSDDEEGRILEEPLLKMCMDNIVSRIVNTYASAIVDIKPIRRSPKSFRVRIDARSKDDKPLIAFDVYYNTVRNVSLYHSDPTNAYYTGKELCLFPRFFIALSGYISDIVPPVSSDIVTLRNKYVRRYDMKILWASDKGLDYYNLPLEYFKENMRCAVCGDSLGDYRNRDSIEFFHEADYSCKDTFMRRCCIDISTSNREISDEYAWKVVLTHKRIVKTTSYITVLKSCMRIHAKAIYRKPTKSAIIKISTDDYGRFPHRYINRVMAINSLRDCDKLNEYIATLKAITPITVLSDDETKEYSKLINAYIDNDRDNTLFDMYLACITEMNQNDIYSIRQSESAKFIDLFKRLIVRVKLNQWSHNYSYEPFPKKTLDDIILHNVIVCNGNV